LAEEFLAFLALLRRENYMDANWALIFLGVELLLIGSFVGTQVWVQVF
jgi:hypothetical protein